MTNKTIKDLFGEIFKKLEENYGNFRQIDNDFVNRLNKLAEDGKQESEDTFFLSDDQKEVLKHLRNAATDKITLFSECLEEIKFGLKELNRKIEISDELIKRNTDALSHRSNFLRLDEIKE